MVVIDCSTYCGLNVLAKIFLFFAMVVHMVIYDLSNQALGFKISSFYSNQFNVSEQYATEITPRVWFYYLDYAVYIWQFAICLYILFSSCMRSPKLDVPMLHYKYLYSPVFSVLYALAFIFHTAWLFVWDRVSVDTEKLLASVVLHFIVALLLGAAILVSQLEIIKCEQDIEQAQRRDLLWIHRVLINVGLGAYGGWVLIRAFINLSVFLIHHRLINTVDGVTISLIVLLVIILAYTVVDLVLLDLTNRYNFGPHAVWIWGLVGMFLSVHIKVDKRNWIILEVIIGLTVLCLVIKIVLCVIRHIRAPRLAEHSRLNN